MIDLKTGEKTIFLRVHPAWCGGKATIGFSRLYVDVLAEAWWAGSTEDEIYRSYSESCEGKPGLLLACWFMARYGSRTWQKRWKDWVEHAESEMWAMNYDIELPPQKITKGK